MDLLEESPGGPIRAQEPLRYPKPCYFHGFGPMLFAWLWASDMPETTRLFARFWESEAHDTELFAWLCASGMPDTTLFASFGGLGGGEVTATFTER